MPGPLFQHTNAGPFQVAYLASGSKGNAAVLRADGFRVLLDCGLAKKTLVERLSRVGLRPEDIDAAVLTHGHGDHWRASVLAMLAKQTVPVHVHEGHVRSLSTARAWDKLVAAKCAHVHGRAGTDWRPLDLGPFRVQPLPASHDAPGCHGFAVSAHGASYVHMADVGYLTDGHLAAAGSADTLALEFNHDLDMLYHSGRPPWLIERIRGRSGHLSNAQAIDALTRLRQERRLPRQVLALHLSDECNHPTKAHSAVRHVLSGRSAGLFQCVPQHQPLSWVDVGSV